MTSWNEIQQKTRLLSSRWTFEDTATNRGEVEKQWAEEQKALQLKKLTDLITCHYVTKYWTVVPVFQDHISAHIWAYDEIKCSWHAKYDAYRPVSDEAFLSELLSQLNKTFVEQPQVQDIDGLGPFDIAELIKESLSAEITREIDSEILKSMGLKWKVAQRYFYFQDVNEALRFKLMWGGE